MASKATTSKGVQLKRGNGAGTEVFTKIGEVNSFSGPSGSATVINVSSLDSVAQEKLMGIADEGQLTFSMNFIGDDVQQAGLREDRIGGVLRNFQLVLTDEDATTLTFSAFVLNFSIEGGVDQAITASCTLEISGEVEWA